MPGFALARAISSFTLFTPSVGRTTRKFCDDTICETGVKSVSTLNGSFEENAGAIVRFAVPVSSV